VVNLADVEQHFDAGATVDEASLKKAGLVKGRYHGVKLLAQGGLTKKVTVRVHKASEAAKSAVQQAGGAVEELPLMAHKPEAAAKAHSGKGVKAPRQPKA
jgi:large subunit ribosomal protein L15